MTETDKQTVPTKTSEDASFEPGTAKHAHSGGASTRYGENGLRRRSGPIAWLAFFLALIATAGAGWSSFTLWKNSQRAAQELASLNDQHSRTESLQNSVAKINSDILALDASDADTAKQLADIDRDLTNKAQQLDALPGRVASIEQTLSSLQGISSGAQQAWLVAEAAYYLQVANATLQLARNPNQASLALGVADDRLAQLANPALTGIRQAIADERATLDALQLPDIEGITLTLASLAGVVETLPLHDEQSPSADKPESVDPNVTGMARAWKSLKKAVSGLVSYSRPGESEVPLTSPDAANFLRANLALQLQAARVALLQGEQAVFNQSLDDASRWLKQYFDADSAPVTAALQTLTEIRAQGQAVTLPDISASLLALRQFRNSAASSVLSH